MDADRFDALSRAASTTQPRRRLTRLLGGLSLGAVLSALGTTEAAAGSRLGGSSCTKDDQCQTGRCVGPAGNKRCSCSREFPTCRGDQICCRRRCVSLESNPRHCGECGKRCQLNAVCDAGTCTCVRGACAFDDATCCPTTAVRPVPCRCTSATDPRTCETAGSVDLCPSGTVACLGPRCGACCPVGSTCDTSTGTCLQ
jgi:hypothetical protein